MSLSGWVLTAYVAAVTVPLTMIDVREHRLPNRLVVPGIALATVTTGSQVLASGGRDWTPLICGVGAFMVFLVLAVTGGMGMGDVKLAALLGAASGFLGWQPALAGLLLTFLLGGLGGLVSLIRRKPPRQFASRNIPFGPFMLAGFWVVWGATLWSLTTATG